MGCCGVCQQLDAGAFPHTNAGHRLLQAAFNAAKPACRFSNMPDATKAMQQIDGLEIANQKISVKIAAMSAAETAAAAMASQVDLDGAEGAAQLPCSSGRACKIACSERLASCSIASAA